MAVRVAIVGMGMSGREHLAAWRSVPGAHLAAVCDPDARRLGDAESAERFGDLDELLENCPVDVIDCCAPTYLHEPLAVRALEAGCHVFCESPLALTSPSARAIVDHADRARRLLGAGHASRYQPEYALLAEIVRSGRYGPVQTAVFTRVCGVPDWSWDDWMVDPSRSGGAALDLHVHDVDLVQWIFGRPQRVMADGDMHDFTAWTVTANYFFAPPGRSGPMVVAVAGWQGSQPLRKDVAIKFRDAVVEYSSAAAPAVTIRHGDEVEHPQIAQTDGLVAQLADFARGVESGREVGRGSIRDAADAIAVVEAELTAIREGGAVTVGY